MTKFDYDKIVPGFDREAVVEQMRQNMSEFRFTHCLRVEKQAQELAEKFGADVLRAGLAGLLHDFAKERSDEQFVETIKKHHLDPELLHYGNAIWHGIVGAEIIKDELGVYDEVVLNAIRRHTVGSTSMTGVDKCVFIADFIEPKRDFPGIEDARKYAAKSLNSGVAFELKHSIAHLIDKNRKIYPETFVSYNYWIDKGEL